VFLEARIGEDEAAANAATGSVWTYGPYEPYEPSDEGGVVCDDDDKYVAQTQYDDQPLTTLNSDGNGVHIARWDPARVLAEVEAKRRIVDWCRHVEVFPANRVADGVLRLLALPYAEHPDFDPAWRLS